MRGRVMSVFNVAFRGGGPIGSLIIGKLIPIFNVGPTMVCVGLALAAIALIHLTIFRRVSEL